MQYFLQEACKFFCFTNVSPKNINEYRKKMKITKSNSFLDK